MRSLFILTALIFAISAHARSTTDGWLLLISGDYHGDEAPDKPGTGWLALTSVGGGWRLEPAIVRATRVYDAVLDAEGEKTGINISSNYGDAVALLKFPGIKPGKIDTPIMKFKDSPRLLSTRDTPLKIPFKGEDYLIEAKTSGIYLRKGKVKTLLPRLSAGSPASDDSASLLWAGDIDGDGKLDLLFTYSGHNNGGVCLYLSAGASEGALVQQAACHGGVGC